jgi:hypothetical protein
MRGKVREVKPERGDDRIEVFDVEVDPAAGREPPDRRRHAPYGSDPAPAGHVTGPVAPTVAADAGPNADVVADMLRRAAAMTGDQRRRLAGAASWRWGGPTPLLGVAQAPVARARATVLARGAGRGDAIRTIVVACSAPALADGRRSRFVAAAVADACLAVLARDLIEPEVFETLYGPWRDVMHH